ncbi:MAG TPA: UvrD-helicase domain-containing protein, partial [bacterium]|nr:UvrD-helicase domain-containing protein [bacterium]
NELKEKFEPAEQGLYKLKNEYALKINNDFELNTDNNIRFILTTEISNIYKKYDKVRKIHNLIFSPDFDTVEKIQSSLKKIGNIISDGRPILGLDSKDLLDIILNISDKNFLIPAHIWTPWFSLLGSNSGFDSLFECFEDYSNYIFAIETGLSSDPPMNWLCSFLDNISITSNSDAHSPEKLGREANIFNCDFSFDAIKNALKFPEKNQFLGTIEFFPEEGKYHFDGHRKCNIVLSPNETNKYNQICPKCGKKLTIGVMYRVFEISDRTSTADRKNKKQFFSLIPLIEILSEIYQSNEKSKKIQSLYFSLIKKFGSEFNILLNVDINTLKNKENELLAEAIKRMRDGKVIIKPGFDGEYGKIRLFTDEELNSSNKFFLFEKTEEINKAENQYNFKNELLKFKNGISKNFDDNINAVNKNQLLNQSQLDAVNYIDSSLLIIAGPGTGKTNVFAYKIIFLLNNGIQPSEILSLTFANEAAKEMFNRIKTLLNNTNFLKQLNIFTFHSFGLFILKDYYNNQSNFTIINDNEKELILKDILNIKNKEIKKIINEISEIKQKFLPIDSINDELKQIYIKYNDFLQKNFLFDFDDLIFLPIIIFQQNKNYLEKIQNKFKWIIIDEYQDINYAQYLLVKKISENKKIKVCVIGDPNQAIYTFRGADSKFINNFQIDFPDAKLFLLNKSYRCSDSILSASLNIIANNDEKNYFLKGTEKGLKINILECQSVQSEAEFVARTIENLIGGISFFSFDSNISDGEKSEHINSFSDIAVLCRISKQFEPIKNAFLQHNIPFQIINENFLFTNEPFCELLNLIKFLTMPENNFYKIILKKINKNFPINELNKIFNNNSLKNFLAYLFENYYKNYYNEFKDYFDLLIKIADNINNPIDFLNEINTMQTNDLFQKTINKVPIMTMHSAKGLEFNAVFIVGCNSSIIPFNFYKNYNVNIEDEKRLMYVAMTRAKKYLYLTYTKTINYFGGIIQSEISPFLTKIKKELIEFKKQELKEKNKQLSLF